MQLKIFKELPDNIASRIREFDVEGLLDFCYDPFTFSIGVVFHEDGSILGVGMIRVVNEFKMIINDKLQDYTKAKMIKMLLEEAKNLSQCNEIIVEITKGGPHYEAILENHFDFQPTQDVLRMEK